MFCVAGAAMDLTVSNNQQPSEPSPGLLHAAHQPTVAPRDVSPMMCVQEMQGIHIQQQVMSHSSAGPDTPEPSPTTNATDGNGGVYKVFKREVL